MNRDRSSRLALGLLVLLMMFALVRWVGQRMHPNIGVGLASQIEGVVQVTGGELPNGVEAGDLIVSALGQPVSTSARYAEVIGAAPGAVDLQLLRKGSQSVGITIENAKVAAFATRETGPCVLLPTVATDAPAHRAGLLPGDLVVAVGGEPLTFAPSPDPLQRALGVPVSSLALRLVAARNGDRLPLRVARPEGEVDVEVVVASIGFWSDGFANLGFQPPAWVTLGLLGLAWLVSVVALRATNRRPPEVWAWYAAFFYWAIALGRPGAGYGAMYVAFDVGLIGSIVLLVLAGQKQFRPRFQRSWMDGVLARLGGAGRAALGPIGSIVFAAAAFLVLFSIDAATPLSDDKGLLTWLRRMTFHEGMCGQAILFVFLLGCVTLIGIRRRMAADLQVDDIDPTDGLGDLPPGAFWTVADGIQERFPSDPSYQAVKDGAAAALDEVHDQWARSFVRVGWTEAAMPILGFLGTVVGFASALPPLKTMLQERISGRMSGGDDLLAKAMGECMDNMSLAFNTTFLGLLGVLILGLLHVITRSSVRNRLSRLATLVDKRIEALPTTSQAGEIAVVTVSVAESREAIDRLREEVVRGRAFVDAMIAEGDTPFWQDARRVAFQGVVGFEEAPRKDLEELVDEALEGEEWSFRDLVAAGADGRAHALVHSQGGRQWILRFGLSGGAGELFALPEDEEFGKVVGADGNLAAHTATMQGGVRAQRISLDDGQAEPRGAEFAASRILPWAFGRHELLLEVHTGTSALGWRPADGKIRALAQFMPGMLDHARIAAVPGAVFLCCEQDGAHVLYRLAPKADEKGWPMEVAVGAPSADLGAVAPREIAALSADELLLVGGDGHVWCWSVHRIRPARVPQVDVPEGADLITGRRPWFAVANNNQLAMWRVMLGVGGGAGGLDVPGARVPDERPRRGGDGGAPHVSAMQFKDRAGVAKSYPIGGVTGLVASGDGKHVIGYRGRTIFTWSFPATRLDV